MNRLTRIIAMIATTMALHSATAQDKPAAPAKPAATSPTAPATTDTLKVKYFKALSQQQEAQAQFQNAQKAMQDSTTNYQKVVQEVVAVCGDKFTAQMDKDGDPVCVIKPPEPVKPASAK